ncbi:hypothetical protein NDU88_007177 [Pleurodeles waltl]|uniref:Secreted protein n=1 Tax=Pleurodeles waltl TaxID=8319 RepID=A0AAV7N568_PLEWA|nr:hypothetical protein NDU88_007177 [Pleurodeles waltl]
MKLPWMLAASCSPLRSSCINVSATLLSPFGVIAYWLNTAVKAMTLSIKELRLRHIAFRWVMRVNALGALL